MSKNNKQTQLEGKLEAFNISPKGILEGLLVSTKSGMAQANFSGEAAEAIHLAVHPGEKISLEVEPHDDERPGLHPVYKLLRLATAAGKNVDLAGGSFEGKAVRLNYAKHGEPNGAVLDTGDFVHVKPHGAKLLKLAVGQVLQGQGERKPMALGGNVIEAVMVNGVALDSKKPAKKLAAKKVPAKKVAGQR